ncbi:MAG: LCCL domain-containing protein [Myxococcota bacterium]
MPWTTTDWIHHAAITALLVAWTGFGCTLHVNMVAPETTPESVVVVESPHHEVVEITEETIHTDGDPIAAQEATDPAHVQVEWRGSWYDARILRENTLDDGSRLVLITYVGYDNTWDEWVPPSRIRSIAHDGIPPRVNPPTPDKGEQLTATAQDDSCPSQMPSKLASLSCTCTPSQIQSGSTVWGTDTYTSDSALCAAAFHSGVIGADGGPIEVRSAPGCTHYLGSERQGVASKGYGSWSGSFYFPARSQGECPSI